MGDASTPSKDSTVDIYFVDTDISPVAEAGAARVLGQEERLAALKLAGVRRTRFVARRAARRRIIARHLDTDGAAILFVSSPHGKPGVSVPTCDLRFNASSASSLAIVAVTSQVEVGVDLEAPRAGVDPRLIAASLLSTDAIAPIVRRYETDDCYAWWCRVEAALKCVGTGFAIADRIDPGPCVVDLDAPKPYAAAVAIASTAGHAKIRTHSLRRSEWT